jgi:hypothetical protein
LLDIGCTKAFIPGPVLVNGAMDGKLAASATVEVEIMGALLVTETGKFSVSSVAEGSGVKAEGAGDKAEGAGEREEGAGDKADGAGGKFDRGKEADVTLEEVLVLKGSKGSKDDGSSGKLEDTVGKERLKLGYCIGCGIDKPGGGRSKDCWCN